MARNQQGGGRAVAPRPQQPPAQQTVGTMRKLDPKRPEDIRVLVQQMRDEMLQRLPDFESALRGIVPPDTFIEIALTTLITTDDSRGARTQLLLCSPESVLLAALKSAHSGLRLDGKQAALIPYGNAATFMPMVKGVIDLIKRSPDVAKLESRCVYEGDFFDWELGLTPKLVHKPKGEVGTRKITHAYAIVWWKEASASPTFEVMDAGQIEYNRQTFAKAPNSPAWTKSPGEMYRKTVVHRISKYVDLDAQTAARLKAITEAEFEIVPGAPAAVAADVADDASSRIRGQLDSVRERVQLARSQLDEQTVQEERSRMLDEIRSEIRRHQLTDEESFTEVKAALGIAQIDLRPEFETEEGQPNVKVFTHPMLAAVLEHFRQLGPGFDGGDGGGQGAPEGSEAGEGAPEGATGAPDGSGGAQGVPFGSGEASGLAGGSGGAQAAPAPPLRMMATNTVNLRKWKRGPNQVDALIHVTDPDKKPARRGAGAVCIGCGRELNPAHIESASPSSEPAKYCADALVVLLESYEDERIPDGLLDAVKAFERSQS